MTSTESLIRIRADHSDGTVSGYSSGQVTPTGLPAPTFSVGLLTNPADPRYPIHLAYTPSASGASSGVYEYRLEYQSSTTAGPGWIPYGTQDGLEGGDSESTDLNLADGATGSFRLQAIYNDGYKSEWAYAGPVTAPLEINEVVVDAPGVSATVVSSTEINLSWQTNDDVSIGLAMGTLPGLDGEGDSGTVSTFSDVNENGTSYLALTGLTPGTQYFFAVSSGLQMSGGITGLSYNAFSATTTNLSPPLPPIPAEPTLSAEVTTTPLPAEAIQGTVHLHWTNNSDNETGFIVERSSDGGTTWTNIGNPGADTTTLSDSNLQPGSYSYRVCAKNAGGESPWSTTSVQVQGTWNQVAPDVLKTIQAIANVDYTTAATLKPIFFSLLKQGLSGQAFTNILSAANLQNINTGIISVLFSPKDITNFVEGATVNAYNTLINANGLVVRGAGGRFAALAVSSKALVKTIDVASLALPVIDWGLNTAYANLQITQSTADLLDDVSQASSAAQIAASNLMSIYNDAMADGAAMDVLYASLDQHICDDSAQQLATLRTNLNSQLTAVQQYQSTHLPGWQQLSALANQLGTQLAALSRLANFTVNSGG